MNRFTAFAILTLAALAVANSAPPPVDYPEIEDEVYTQAMLDVDDKEETRLVEEQGMDVFAGFCIQSRDFVFADVKQKAGSASSQGFSLFFSMTEEIAMKAIKANQDATARLSNQLANPETKVEGDDTVAEAQREVQGQNQPKALFSAIQGALRATADAVVTVASQKFSKVKEFADPKKAQEFASYACREVGNYEKELRKQFDEYKLSSLPEEAQAQYENVKFEDVPCITASRIARANGVCQFIVVAFDPMRQLMQLFKN